LRRKRGSGEGKELSEKRIESHGKGGSEAGCSQIPDASRKKNWP